MKKYVSIALHIRHGDYEDYPKFGLCTKQYYQNAINMIENELDNPKFYIFTEDHDWVDKNLKFSSPYEIIRFSENLKITPEKYLDMLEQCYGGFLFADNDEMYNPNCPKMFCPACIAHCMMNNGKLLPYSASGKYDFVKNALKNNPKNLSWLFGKDGQDPLFSDSVETDVKGKQLGSLLIQLGFATRTKVIINHSDAYVTWRYRFEFPLLSLHIFIKLSLIPSSV